MQQRIVSLLAGIHHSCAYKYAASYRALISLRACTTLKVCLILVRKSVASFTQNNSCLKNIVAITQSRLLWFRIKKKTSCK